MTAWSVKVHDIATRPDRGAKGKSYRVRWTLDGRRFERSFTAKALADRFRSELLRGAAAGLAFDVTTGLPQDLARERNQTTWYEHALSYVESKWPSLAPKSRRSVADALATVTPALVKSVAVGTPEATVLRAALYGWAFNPSKWSTELGPAERSSLDWLKRASVPVVRLANPDVVRAALNACTRRLDGRPAAATVVVRKRAVLYNALGFAVERGLLVLNPIERVQWRAPEVAERVDRRVVASTAQVEQLLAALPAVDRQGAALIAFFGALYFGGLRPSEAASLRLEDCHLPATGWGRITLTETAANAGSSWTDDGSPREVRGLKHRAEHEVRHVPIPPDLVRLLRSHVDAIGVAEDGRLFRAARGGYLSESAYGQAWRKAREAVFTPAQVASPLAGRPYDLRHAAVTLWLNGGVPATEVAQRAGHGVAVLLKVYAGCIDGETDVMNAKIEAALEASRGRGRIGGNDA